MYTTCTCAHKCMYICLFTPHACEGIVLSYLHTWFYCGVGEDSWESLVHPRGNQSWIFIGRTNAEAETPVLWPPDAKNWLIWKDPDARQDWSQEKKGMTDDEMVGWHHRLDGHEFEWALGVGQGQRSLACCSPWGRKELDTTEQLNWTEILRAVQCDAHLPPRKPHKRPIVINHFSSITLLLLLSRFSRVRLGSPPGSPIPGILQARTL